MRVGSEVPNRKTEVFGWGSWTVWSKKRGEQGGGGVGPGGVGCSWSGAGRGGAGKGGGSGGGGVGWSGRVVKGGGFGG